MSCKKKVDEEFTYIRAEKALGEDLDYFITYAKTFALVSPADSISTPGDSTWALVGSGTLGATGVTGDITHAWVSGGGRIGNILRLTNTVVTAGGRTHVRLIVIKIVNRLAVVPADDLVTIETP